MQFASRWSRKFSRRGASKNLGARAAPRRAAPLRYGRILDTPSFLLHGEPVSRTAEDLLEFPRLREIVARRTTCAPGRRAILTLEPGSDAAALTAQFDLIREAVEYLRAGSELGFWFACRSRRMARAPGHSRVGSIGLRTSRCRLAARHVHKSAPHVSRLCGQISETRRAGVGRRRSSFPRVCHSQSCPAEWRNQ
jgi:hypothetical protein